MARCLFRLRLPDGSVRLAAGDGDVGPSTLLPAGRSLADLLALGPDALREAVDTVGSVPVPAGSSVVAPVDRQEVWAAGVTYERSRDARMVESAASADAYDRVYVAERPELFFKAFAWRVRGPGEPIGIRADSTWDVPEPELALVVTPDLRIAGFTIANDVSSRSIEGENPLYLPQAKTYEGSCALGPCIVPASLAEPPFTIRLTIQRGDLRVFSDEISTSRLHRSLEDLVEHLGRALAFPDGVILLTGTGIVPDPTFTLLDRDHVRIEISSLGVLENPVVTVGRRAPLRP